MRHFILISLIMLFSFSSCIGQGCKAGTSQFIITSNGIKATLDTKGTICAAGEGVLSKNMRGEWTQNIFAAGPWLNGKRGASTSSRYLALSEYGERGVDYYPGPIINGVSDSSACENWDQLFTISKDDIVNFLLDLDDNGRIDNEIPNSILGWPARSNPHFFEQHGFSLPEQDLAPFVDANGDFVYNPEDGDYPKIKGDEYAWWVINDIGNRHRVQFTHKLNYEIHYSAFIFRNNSGVLDRTIYYELEYLNKSGYEWSDFFFSMWMDPEFGCGNDDFFGVNTEESLLFFYNEDFKDGEDITSCDFSELNTFDVEIPMVGIKILKSPTSIDDLGLNYFQRLDPEKRLKFPDSLIIEFNGDPRNTLDTSMCTRFVRPKEMNILWGFGPTEIAVDERRKLAFAVYTTETQQYPCPSWDAVIADGRTIEEIYKSETTGSKEEVGRLSELTVFPNPAFESVSIELKHSRLRVSKVTAYDITGRSSVLNKLDQSSFDIKHLNSGIYFLDIKLSSGKSLRQKLIVGE